MLKNHEKLSFTYGDEIIEFEVIAKLRAHHKISIKVTPDCKVQVSTSLEVEHKQLLDAVKKRSRWIYQQLQVFHKQNEFIVPRQYVSGESHYYLGKQYQLKVIESRNQPQGVKLLRGKLEVTVKHKDAQKVQDLLNAWYRVRAKEVFTRCLETVFEQALWVSEAPKLKILNMKTQWGNCSPSGNLTLNPYLVKAPTRCIDYVILHELCHLVEHNHSKQFYELMTQVMPDWEKRKKYLDGMAARIFNNEI